MGGRTILTPGHGLMLEIGQCLGWVFEVLSGVGVCSVRPIFRGQINPPPML